VSACLSPVSHRPSESSNRSYNSLHVDSYACIVKPLTVAQLREKQTTDAESFRAMYNAISAENNKLSAENDRLSNIPETGRHLAQERVGRSLLQRACFSGTKRELQTAMAQARVLEFELGSSTPFLNDKFQDLRFIITDRMVSCSPVWAAAVGGEWFMYRRDDGTMWVSNESHSAQGSGWGYIHSLAAIANVVAPTDFPSDKWVSAPQATLEPQYASAERFSPRDPWARVPYMRITAVHGLTDGDPAMAAALQRLAAIS